MLTTLLTSLMILGGPSDHQPDHILSWVKTSQIEYLYGDTTSVVDTSLHGLTFSQIPITKLPLSCDGCQIEASIGIHIEGQGYFFHDLDLNTTTDPNTDNTWTYTGYGSFTVDNVTMVDEDGESKNGKCETDESDCEVLYGCNGRVEFDFTSTPGPLGSITYTLSNHQLNGIDQPDDILLNVDNDTYPNTAGNGGMNCSDAVWKRWSIEIPQEDGADIYLGYFQIILWCHPCDVPISSLPIDPFQL